MRPQRRPWDPTAFFIGRTDPEHERRGPLQSTGPLEIQTRINVPLAILCWRGLGVEISENRIRRHWIMLRRWQRRRPKLDTYLLGQH